MPLAPGTRLGAYEVTAPLGTGGMGEVYRATDSRLGREVAIKALPAEFAQDEERLSRFEREARLLASLSHPNIAGIFGLEEVGGARYLVLELVEGESLAERLTRGPLPIDEALDVAKQIAAGVEAAHENGVIHRDLKPGNVMITPSGSVKVLDFGLAKSEVTGRSGSDPHLSASPTMTHAMTRAGMILGTAAYMSPEQARGRAVDKRTDIWSFGCVLYECLTGRQAFEGETVSDLVAKILERAPEWSRLPAATPARVRTLLARCLEKDARGRLRDIGEARIALSETADPEAPAAAVSRPGGVPWWLTACVALLAAALAGVAALRFGGDTGPVPVRRFDLIANDMVVSWPIAPRLAPDGSRYAYSSTSHIWVRDLDRLEARSVADVSDAAMVSWSPDSREIVYADDGKLWRVSVESGRPTAICEIPESGRINGAGWSPSGTIAFAVWRGGMYQVAAGGGRATPLVDLDPGTQIDFHFPTWLPNGELLYITHGKLGEDGPGEERESLTILDGEKQIPIAGDFGDIDDAPVLTHNGWLVYMVTGETPGIWTVPLDLEGRRATGTPVLVVPGAVTVSASDDGSLLYVEGASVNLPHELVWVDRTGKKLESVGRPHMKLNHARLSPDGTRIAFGAADGGNDDIWVLDLTSGAETRLTFGPQVEAAPEWLDSSSRLAYAEQEGDGMKSRVLSINADGSGGQRPFAPGAFWGSSYSSVEMAPGGRSAIRVVDQQGHGSLQIGPVLPDGTLGPLKPLLAQVPEPNVREARISPDGRLVAYQTNDPGKVDVFLARFPEGEGRWQVGTEGGFVSRWARGGGELLFIAGSGPTRRSLVSAIVDSSREPPLGALTRLFDLTGEDDGNDFDVTADGQRILLTRPAGGGGSSARHVVLVENWQSEIEGGK